MSEGPVTVFRSTDESVYLPLVAAMNGAGIRARAMDTAQAGLRWDVQVISPVEVWVPGDDATAAHLFIAEHAPAAAVSTSCSTCRKRHPYTALTHP